MWDMRNMWDMRHVRCEMWDMWDMWDMRCEIWDEIPQYFLCQTYGPSEGAESTEARKRREEEDRLARERAEKAKRERLCPECCKKVTLTVAFQKSLNQTLFRLSTMTVRCWPRICFTTGAVSSVQSVLANQTMRLQSWWHPGQSVSQLPQSCLNISLQQRQWWCLRSGDIGAVLQVLLR